ncbi:MAG TPA: hypothetical protein VN903_28200, partial [Polyangia bacterium]|nr:hypothetical protein [Polyangia bacterium]
MSNLNLNLNPIAAPPPARVSAPGRTESRLEIDATRARQTERPAAPFRSVLAGGVSLLMTGAEVATHVVGGPVLAAAVHDARLNTASAFAGPGAAASPPGAATAIAAATGATGNPEMSSMEALMQQGQASNMQLLALQEHVQQENQRFTTVSNVMR